MLLLCNNVPCQGSHSGVIVLAWLTRLTEMLITVAGPLGCHTVAVVMSSLLIPVINLASDHSKEVCQELTGGGIAASGGSVPLHNTVKLVVKLFREHCNYDKDDQERWEITFTSWRIYILIVTISTRLMTARNKPFSSCMTKVALALMLNVDKYNKINNCLKHSTVIVTWCTILVSLVRGWRCCTVSFKGDIKSGISSSSWFAGKIHHSDRDRGCV